MKKNRGEDQRKERTDKKERIQIHTIGDTKTKFNRIARACNVSESELGSKMLTYLVNNPDFVRWVQDEYRVSNNDPFRIIPIIENGKLTY
jgi:hypothetical protein